MSITSRVRLVLPLAGLALASFSLPAQGVKQPLATGSSLLSTGQRITPLAPPGARFEPLTPHLSDFPEFVAGQAVSSLKSGDGKTLFILTSGYNQNNDAKGNTVAADSNEYVFVFDISQPAPVQKQVLQVPNTYSGIALSPDGSKLYVGGGQDDNIHVFALTSGSWTENATPFALNHKAANGVDTPPGTAGLAVTADGKKIIVANFENDSITVVDAAAGQVLSEFDLRPGKLDPVNATGVAGGEYPFWIAIKGNEKAYVSSVRDREIDVVDIAGTPQLTARLKVNGSPNKLLLNAAGSKLFAALDDADTVDVFDTVTDKQIDSIKTTSPAESFANEKNYRGSIPNSLALSPDEKTLYATNAGSNSLAVIDISVEPNGGKTVGLIPTGWFPNSVTLSADGKTVYVANGKSVPGPNPGNCNAPLNPATTNCSSTNQYIWQLTKAGFQSFPAPTKAQLSRLTETVIANNRFGSNSTAREALVMSELHKKIKHVIYILKENRTYDQILGDLEVGNGDPDLVEFPQGITPNQHQVARDFVALDNFFDSGDVSGNGWSWSNMARTKDATEKEVPVNYAGRGYSYDPRGTNRNVNVGLPTAAARLAVNPLAASDPDVLPGTTNINSPDDRFGDAGQGYFFDEAIRAKKAVRNYGFYIELNRYGLSGDQAKYAIPLIRDPYAAKTVVAYPANPNLRPLTDRFYRGFDNAFANYYNYKEWSREFDNYVAGNDLPDLELVELGHDHTGSFSSAIDGVNTPQTQVADNDYAVGLLIDKVAHSPYKDSTLIFAIEDDPQDGPDHVDAHRSVAYIVGPYVKHNQVVSNYHNTVDMIRTMEDILGIDYLNLNDAYAHPMADVFDLTQKDWTFTANVPDILYTTQLPLPPRPLSRLAPMRPSHDVKYWAAKTRGFDFSEMDKVNPEVFNRVLWEGIMGDRPFPVVRSGADLRDNRSTLLKDWRARRDLTK